MMPDQVQKLLRQQSKDFCAADFDALVKQWDKCITVGGGYVEKYIVTDMVFPAQRLPKYTLHQM
jgi:hypothetical protein